MLSGIDQNVLDQLLRTETTDDIPEDAIFMATATLGESTKAAVAAAEAWLAEQESDDAPAELAGAGTTPEADIPDPSDNNREEA
jgi:hypothetical protein